MIQVMMPILLLCYSLVCFSADAKESRSKIVWAKLEPSEWTSFERWKQEAYLKIRFPDWEDNFLERTFRGEVGKILDHLGDVRILRGPSEHRPQLMSSVLEGDELKTVDGSAWLALSDGTLLRMGPDSSVTLREINVSEKNNFLSARLNYGHFVWLSRVDSAVMPTTLRTTDAQFLPPRFFSLNRLENHWSQVPSMDRGVLFKLLNELIAENNKRYQQKVSVGLIATPAGIFYGQVIRAEFYVSLQGSAFVRSLGLSPGRDSENFQRHALHVLPTAGKSVPSRIKEEEWLEVSPELGKMSLVAPVKLRGLRQGEIISLRIPELLVARELLIRDNFGPCFFTDIDKERFKELCRQRQWQNFEEKKGDMFRKFAFLKDYLLRLERSQYQQAKKYLLETHGHEEFYPEKYSEQARERYRILPALMEARQRLNRKKVKDSLAPLWDKFSIKWQRERS